MWAATKLYVAKGRVRSWKKVLHLECNDSTGLGVLAAHVEGKLSYGDLGERTTVAEIFDLERRRWWGEEACCVKAMHPCLANALSGCFKPGRNPRWCRAGWGGKGCKVGGSTVRGIQPFLLPWGGTLLPLAFCCGLACSCSSSSSLSSFHL
jgi:hypothetical protein